MLYYNGHISSPAKSTYSLSRPCDPCARSDWPWSSTGVIFAKSGILIIFGELLDIGFPQDLPVHTGLFQALKSTWGKQRSMDCIRLLGWLFFLILPKISSSSLSLRLLPSSKVQPLFLRTARYFLTVFQDESIWAAINRVLRPWLFILKIFLIITHADCQIGHLKEDLYLKRWLLLQHLLRVMVGQFAPKWCGLIHHLSSLGFTKGQ